MIFDDWTITAIEAGTDPFVVKELNRLPNGTRMITWIAEPKFTYQVEYSDNLVMWKNDLPGSFISGVASQTDQTYTDTSVLPDGAPRYYRVRRVFQP